MQIGKHKQELQKQPLLYQLNHLQKRLNDLLHLSVFS